MAMAEIHPHGNDRRTSFPYQCVGCHNVKNAIFQGHFRSETAIRSDAKFYEIALPFKLQIIYRVYHPVEGQN